MLYDILSSLLVLVLLVLHASPSSEDSLALELDLQLEMLEFDEKQCGGSRRGEVGGDWSSSSRSPGSDEIEVLMGR